MKAKPGSEQSEKVNRELPKDAMDKEGGVCCAPGLRRSSIARWPCPGCEVGASYPYSPPARCPYEPVAA